MKNISNLDTYEVVAMTNNELQLIDGGLLGTIAGVIVCWAGMACKIGSEILAGKLL